MQEDIASSHQHTRCKRDAPAGPYTMRLDPEDRVIYEAAGGELDLTEEIRLLRTVLALLGPDLAGKVREASTALSTLKGLIDTQAKLNGSSNDVEHALVEAAERVLGSLSGQERGDDDGD